MGPQTRMFRILLALALSMISGAWVLSSTGNKPRQAASNPGLLLSAQSQRQLGPGLQASFDHIVVRCEVSDRHNLMPGNGFNGVRIVHVVITERGLIHVQPAWSRLQRLPGDTSALVVRVEVPSSSSDLSALQYEALQGLLDHLSKELAPPPRFVQCVSDHPNVTDFATSVSRVFRVLPVHSAPG